MKLVRHYEQVVVLFERAWEKAYVLEQRATQEWLPLVLPGQDQPCAELHTKTRTVRLCGEYQIQTEQRVIFQNHSS